MCTTTRITAFLWIGLLLAGSAWGQETAQFTLEEAESTVRVDGTSSLHDWSCEAKTVEAEFTALLTEETKAIDQVTDATVSVAVSDLECGKGRMNRKTYDALGADDHPTIQYTLQSADLQKVGQNGRAEFTTTGQLTIRDATKSVEMTVQGKVLDGNRIQFQGQLPLVMTDYDVDPPTAFFGALKTGEEVVVHFDVIATPVTSTAARTP